MARGKIKTLLLLGLAIYVPLASVGCMFIPIPPSFAMKNSIEFHIYDDLIGQDAVYKNNWPQCKNKVHGQKESVKYLTAVSTCKLEEGYVPEEIVIEYAEWLTLAQQNKIPELAVKETYIYRKKIARDTGLEVDEVVGRDEAAMEYNGTVRMKNVQAAIDKLPASAWKKIVLRPQEAVSKYRFTLPEGKGGRSAGKKITFKIYLNPDGSYRVEDSLSWKNIYHSPWP